MYTILDLLDKLIQVEKKAHAIYEEIAESEKFSQSIKTMARVLSREEKRHVEKYRYIKEEIKDKEGLEIDFQMYDKVSKTLSIFTKRAVDTRMVSTDDLLQYALDFEKENLALVIRIQGILVRRLEDEKTIAYRVLSELIREKNIHIKNIERFI